MMPAKMSDFDDAADERAGAREAVPAVSVGKVFSSEEEGLQAFFGSGDYGGVVTEQQSAKHGNKYD